MADSPRARSFWNQLLTGENDPPDSGANHLACAEDGKITFLAMVAMLAFVVLVGFVGNVGQSVHQKLELQNAADAAAYSTTVWMARGMNAITTTNHLMGEITALMVMIESLGGPELDGNREDNKEIRELNNIILRPWETRDGRKLPIDVPSVIEDAIDAVADELLKQVGVDLVTAQGSVAQQTRLSEIDKDFIERVQEMTARDDNGLQDAGAAIYDSQCSMKYYIGKLMKLKFLTNIGYVIGAIFAEPASSAITCGIHITLDVGIADVCKDWILVRGLEVLGRPLRKFVEFDQGQAGAGPYLLLALSLYGDSVAKPGRLEEPIQKTLDQLRRDYAVRELTLFPAAADIALPVVAEEKPRPAGGASQTISPTLWNEDEAEKYSLFVKIVNGPENMLRRAIDRVNQWLSAFKFVGWMTGGDGPEISFDQIMEDLGFPKKWVKLDDSSEDVTLTETVADLKPGGWGYPQNFTLRNRDSLPKFDWETERSTQWARATYPYVDTFRGSWCQFFSTTMGPSNFWTYYKNWTNRYTLAFSYRIRSGTIFPSGLNSLTNQPQVDQLREKLKKWREELRRLRARFDAAREGPNSLQALFAFKKDEFPTISTDLGKLAERIAGELTSVAGVDTKAMGVWVQAVRKKDQPVSEAKSDAAANFDEDSALDQQDFVKLFGKTAQVEVTNRLLLLLERLLSKLENALALLDLGPPHMYVMRDMQPLDKGNEPWTRDRQQAASLFSVVVIATREPWQPAFSSSVYRTPYRKQGTTAVAQSMFYAANGRREIKDVGKNPRQPDTGWDTLNWTPPVEAPEWGLSDPSHQGDRPWDVLTGKHKPLRLAEVRIHWLAKLVPVNAEMVQQALQTTKAGKSSPVRINPEFLLH